MIQKNLTIMLVVLMSIVGNVASAHDIEVDGIYYNITSSSAPLTVAVTNQGSGSYDSDEYSGSVTIPETVTYDGRTYNVTSIEDAFVDCSGLTSITIPKSVTEIGDGAFYECRALTSVTIPENVTKINGCTFFGCDHLTSIIIPNSVTSIGDDAFYGCI